MSHTGYSGHSGDLDIAASGKEAPKPLRKPEERKTILIVLTHILEDTDFSLITQICVLHQLSPWLVICLQTPRSTSSLLGMADTRPLPGDLGHRRE